METKSLKSIQKIVKIGSILNKIAKVFCIIGIICCALVLLSTILIVNGILVIGDLDVILGMLENTDFDYGTMIATCIVGFIECVAALYVIHTGNKFYKSELEIGQPFDYEIANKLKTYGITTIVAPIVASLISLIALLGCQHHFGVSDKMDFSNEVEIGAGILLIIMSLILRYAAEQKELKETNE